MTAETLKPFITPQNVENCPTAQPGVPAKRRQRNTYFLAIGLSTICLILLAALIGFTISLSMRVNNTEAENARLNRVIDNMQKRLGLHYLDDIEDFEKEYANAFTDDPTSLDDLEGNYDDNDHDGDDNDDRHDNDNDDDDDEEEDDDEKDSKKATGLDVNKDSDEDSDDDDSEEFGKLETYDEIREYINKINAMSDKEIYDDNDSEDGTDMDDATASNHEDSSNTSEDDNLYGDFENYKDSKKKKENARITRSITQLPHELTKSNEAKNEPHGTEEHNNTAQSALRPQLRSESSGSSINAPHFVSDKAKSHRLTPLRPRSHRQRRLPTVKSGESLISAKNVNAPRAMPSTALNSIRPAAHFHLNRKVPERHGAIRVDSYPGDMYIGHHPSWSNEVGTQHYFSVQNGVLTVREPGLYYVYAQICYNNTHDQNGFVIFHGHTPFLQCLNTVPTNLPLKIHTCHTSGLIFLRENETIHLRDFHTDRNVILKDSNNRSYFGLIKV